MKFHRHIEGLEEKNKEKKLEEIFDDIQKWNQRDLARFYLDKVNYTIMSQLCEVYTKGSKRMITFCIDKALFTTECLDRCIVENKECSFEVPLIQEYCSINSSDTLRNFNDRSVFLQDNFKSFTQYMSSGIGVRCEDVYNLSLTQYFHLIVNKIRILDKRNAHTVNLALLSRDIYTDQDSSFHEGNTTLEGIIKSHPINFRKEAIREITKSYDTLEVKNSEGRLVEINPIGFEEYHEYVLSLLRDNRIVLSEYELVLKYDCDLVNRFFNDHFSKYVR